MTMTPKQIAEIEARAAKSRAATLSEYDIHTLWSYASTDIPALCAALREAQERVMALENVMKEARDGLASSYQVCDYPANGMSCQDDAIRSIDAVMPQVQS